MVEFARYLGDYFNTSGDNTTLCKERFLRAKGSTVELIALCKEIKFGKRQIENMLVLCKAVFLPRLIYCEAWSNLDKDDYTMLQNSQLNYLRNVLNYQGLYLLLPCIWIKVCCPSDMRQK